MYKIASSHTVTLNSQGILTLCPSTTPFDLALGPTDPGVINIAQETLDFRCVGISPTLRLLIPTFLLLCAPRWLTPAASMYIEHFPTTHDLLTEIEFYFLKSRIHIIVLREI